MSTAAVSNEQILGNYVLLRQLGAGGMGVVVAARHRQLGHPVAIKMMRPELVNDALVERFMREGQAAARLRSVHVARVLDVGVGPTGAPYLTMEYLEGQDLEQVLHSSGGLALEKAVDYLLQAAEAVAEAHAAGIVHRDLKPANLFLARDAYGGECVKVLDFGISKLSGEGTTYRSKLTAGTMLIGTPHYMPPEQMRAADEADARADIWALGAILYEMLTGIPAWSGSTLSEICMRVASDPAPRARERLPALPIYIDRVIAQCLEKDPARRYQSVVELVRALIPIQPEQATAALARIARLTGGAESVPPSPPPPPALVPNSHSSAAMKRVRPISGALSSSGRNSTVSAVRPRARRLTQVVALVVGAALSLGIVSWGAGRAMRLANESAEDPSATTYLDGKAQLPASMGARSLGSEQRGAEALSNDVTDEEPGAKAEQEPLVVLPSLVRRLPPVPARVSARRSLPSRTPHPGAPSLRQAKQADASSIPDWGGRK